MRAVIPSCGFVPSPCVIGTRKFSKTTVGQLTTVTCDCRALRKKFAPQGTHTGVEKVMEELSNRKKPKGCGAVTNRDNFVRSTVTY